MNKIKKKILLVLPIVGLALVLLLTNSCSNDLDVLFPEWDNAPATTPLTSDQRTRMEGIYSVEQGSDQFGSTVILQWTTKDKNYLTVYTGKNTGYLLLQGGQLNTSVYVQGFWRYQNSAETGLSQFTMTEGAAYVLGTSPDSSIIVFTGTWGDGQGTPANSVVFRYVRPIKPELLQENNRYYIISHHGSGGGPEYLPHTENTNEICQIIERYGANSIEIDVRISADGIPYMYHDNTLNPRLIQKGSLVGESENYTYKELQAFVVLKNGERIPTLAAILNTIVTETTLEFVYVDCKPSATNSLGTIAQVCQDARDLAESLNRDVQIYMALTTNDQLNAFVQLPNYQDIPTICELTTSDVQQAGSEVWSPRWTEGTQNSDVAALQQQGKQVICWTVSIPSFMQTYLEDGLFNGMLTDYPHLLAYYYYGQ